MNFQDAYLANDTSVQPFGPATLCIMEYHQQQPPFFADINASDEEWSAQVLNDPNVQSTVLDPRSWPYFDPNNTCLNLPGDYASTSSFGLEHQVLAPNSIDNFSGNMLGIEDIEPTYEDIYNYPNDINQQTFYNSVFDFQGSQNLPVASGLAQPVQAESAQYDSAQEQCLTINTKSIKRRAEKDEGEAPKKPKKSKKLNWANAKPYLRRLYLEKGHTIAELAFEMPVLYAFTAAHSTLEKNLASKLDLRKNCASEPDEAIRLRPGQSFPKDLVGQVAKLAVRFKHPQHQMTIEPGRPYSEQELLFHSIDIFVRGLFGAGDKSWAANTLDLVHPDGALNGHQAWLDLEGTCTNIDHLAAWGMHQQANILLANLFTCLQQELVAQQPSPYFIVYFWKICLIAMDVRTPSKLRQPFFMLKILLGRMKIVLQHFLGRHPLIDLVLSIRYIMASSAEHLPCTLSLGYWKSIHILAEMIGRDHRIILNMESHCAKRWKGKFNVDNGILHAQYDRLYATVQNLDLNFEMEQRIAVLSDYTSSAAQRKGFQTEDVMQAAKELCELSQRDCIARGTSGKLTFTQLTQAFVTASDLLGSHYRARFNKLKTSSNYDIEGRTNGIKYFSTAADVLQRGDVTCLILAADFSKHLAAWIKPNKQTPQAKPIEEANLFQKERARSRYLLEKASKILRAGSANPSLFQHNTTSAHVRKVKDWRKERLKSRNQWLKTMVSECSTAP